MTAQIRDTLIYNGKQYSLASEPLGSYLMAMDITYPSSSTGNYRGYVASWEVIDNKLYLTRLKLPGYVSELDKEGDLFPGEDKTFAEWYTGRLRIPYGDVLEYVHQGYRTIYEKELYLRFLNGKLMGQSEKDNRPEHEEKLAMRRQIQEDKESKRLKNRIRRFFTK